MKRAIPEHEDLKFLIIDRTGVFDEGADKDLVPFLALFFHLRSEGYKAKDFHNLHEKIGYADDLESVFCRVEKIENNEEEKALSEDLKDLFGTTGRYKMAAYFESRPEDRLKMSSSKIREMILDKRLRRKYNSFCRIIPV